MISDFDMTAADIAEQLYRCSHINWFSISGQADRWTGERMEVEVGEVWAISGI